MSYRPDALGRPIYLVHTCNRVNEQLTSFYAALDAGNEGLAMRELVEGARELCDGLSRLSEDDMFFDGLRALEEDVAAHDEAIEETIQALEGLHKLLNDEAMVLNRLGLSPIAVARLIQGIRHPTMSMRDALPLIDPPRLRGVVREAADAACNAARDADREGPRGRWAFVVTVVGRGIKIVEGTLLIVANATADAAVMPVGVSLWSVVRGAHQIAEGTLPR